MNNILSIDFEDWRQLAHRRITGDLIEPSNDVFRQLDALLALLSEHKARATFFTVGMVAERYPQLVRRIAAAGHEVACHGYAHLIVHRLTPDEFRDDTCIAKQLLEDIIGKAVLGYRAAEFSIRRTSLWALDVLADLGFVYDSSIFPVAHRRYGIAAFDPHPARYDLGQGREIVELPLSTLPFAGYHIPIAGGGYFRLLPARGLLRAGKRLNAAGLPLITYLHPYELDPERLSVLDPDYPCRARQRARAAIFNFHQNLGRSTMRSKLSALLQFFQFTTCEEYVDAAGFGPSRALFSALGG